jgi:hypothetical protein
MAHPREDDSAASGRADMARTVDGIPQIVETA